MEESMVKGVDELFPSCAIGYRLWRLTPEGLASTGLGNTVWQPGVNRSKCLANNHASPAPTCHCGFNVMYDLATTLEQTGMQTAWPHPHILVPFVCGSIIARGNVQLHYHGFRAEEAQITALLETPDLSPEARQLLHSLGEKYGVRVFEDPFEMKRFTESLGDTPPKSLRPPDPPPAEIQDPRQEILTNRLVAAGFLLTLGGIAAIVAGQEWGWVAVLVGALFSLTRVAENLAERVTKLKPGA